MNKMSRYERRYWVGANVEALGIRFQAAEVYCVEPRQWDQELASALAQQYYSPLNQDVFSDYHSYMCRPWLHPSEVGDNGSRIAEVHPSSAQNGNFRCTNTLIDACHEWSNRNMIMPSLYNADEIDGDIALFMPQNSVLLPGRAGNDTQELVRAGEWVETNGFWVLRRCNNEQGVYAKPSLETRNVLVSIQGDMRTNASQLRQHLVDLCQHILKYNGGMYRLLSKAPAWTPGTF